MGYNISDVSGNASGGANAWTFTLDLTQPGVSTVSGDFNVVSLWTGNDLGEATSGYTFSALDTTAYGTLTSTNTTDGTFTFTVNRSAVMDSGSDQTVSFTITGTSGANSDDDIVYIEILICVARGTLIATPSGPRAVEDLVAGDFVRTRGGRAKPVEWIGSRMVSETELARSPELRPVRVQSGALGDGLPKRDLLVSPQHRFLIKDWRAELLFGENEVLAPALSLVNDRDILIDHAQDGVEYFHLLFDSHEIILTEGVETESFHPGRYSIGELGDATKVELLLLFPEFFDDKGAFETARKCLRPWEAQLVLPRSQPIPKAA